MDLEREIREMKNIASLYRKRGRIDLSVDLLKIAARIESGVYGPRSLEVALTNCQIGETLCDLSEFDQARENFQRAVEIWQILPPADPQSVLCYSSALTRMQTESALKESERKSGSTAA